MTDNSLPSNQRHQDIVKSDSQQINKQTAQERIYSFFGKIVKQWTPEEVLQEFNRLFIDCLDLENADSVTGIYALFLEDKEQDFRNTIKRCCYIIVNNWDTKRKTKYIQELVALFANYKVSQTTSNFPRINIYKSWLNNFVNSHDFEELKIFSSRYEVQTQGNWSRRYTAYLLVAQSFNKNNPTEQKEAARKLSKQMKDKFKFDLAMYIARSQFVSFSTTNYKNPSILGDNVLRLIKMIIVKNGAFSYDNIANIFINQTKDQTLGEFKENILKYLFYSLETQEFVEILRHDLAEKLSFWKVEHNGEIITKEFLLSICNRVINCLTTENGKQPSALFILLLSQGHALTLVIVLLKIILICKNSRTHLEICIAHLITYYEKYPVEQCKWLIHFMEIFNIAFSIYAEDVEYSLIKMKQDEENSEPQLNLDAYRVFSQLKLDAQS
ncbi:hypothetical protein Cylst_2318 [Cylindrospermum stagnale PCC 7417]|uniref:Uncharacterized protein n=1 Tax=Cylindrospermum stagnale PCC 7417 TaxID=56107 RepID=K9WWF7_9NOST|nr:hypothetical protein [Cylindrospermum stagnale]AFZ24548.1 hypothetical protein Cylst_2318 [Cylindrospermum stagnale PCC 7417]